MTEAKEYNDDERYSPFLVGHGMSMHRRQFYPCTEDLHYWADHDECDKTWFGHYKILDVDLLLDVDSGRLTLGVVGHTQLMNEQAVLYNLPIPGKTKGHKGYVPQFIFAFQNQEVMIAEIPIDWYGQQKEGIFNNIIECPTEKWFSVKST